MLVLSRKAGEDVLIGDHIAVSVIAIQGKRVRLAFNAPSEIVIRRGELAIADGKSSCLAGESECVSKPR